MFASLFRKQMSANMIRCSSPRRVRLGVESLEDRTVPSTMMSNLGPAGDGAQLFGGLAGGVINQRAEQVSVSASGIGRPGDIGEEIPTLTAGNGGVQGGDLQTNRSKGEEIPTPSGGIQGGDLRTNVLRDGEEIPTLTGGALGGVTMRANTGSPQAHVSAFGGSPDAGGVNGSYIPLFTRTTGEEIPQ